MSAGTESTKRLDVSVRAALNDGWRYVTGFPEFLLISWKFLVAAIGTGIAVVALAAAFPQVELIFNLSGVIAIAIIALLSIAYFVAATRHYLLRESNPPVLPFLPAVLVRFLVYSLVAITLLMATIAAVLAGASAAAQWTNVDEAALETLGAGAMVTFLAAALVIIFYMSGRVCPWLTAPCIGKSLTPGESWRATSTAAIRIFFGLALIGVAFGLLDAATDAIPPYATNSTDDIYEMMFRGRAPLIVSFAIAVKIAFVFVQIGLFAAFAGSIYRQTMALPA